MDPEEGRVFVPSTLRPPEMVFVGPDDHSLLFGWGKADENSDGHPAHLQMWTASGGYADYVRVER